MIAGVSHHPPGKLSRRGVVDVGLKCVHSCAHCFYSYMDGSADQFAGMRHAHWHNRDNMLALVDSLADHGFESFDVTGGEPTIYPHLVEVIARAAGRGLAARIITLGQFLARRDFALLEALLDAGLADFRFSLHAVEPEMFRRMTGGQLDLLVAAMDALQRRGFQYVTNTTVTEENCRALPEIARWIAARPEIYQATLLFFMPYYQWSTGPHAGAHRVRYSEIASCMREAVATIEAAGIGCTIRYAPQCTIRGMERNHVGITGVRHDPHEWMNAIDHTADPETLTLAQARAMGAPLPLREWEAGAALQAASEAVEGIWAARGSKAFPGHPCRGCAAISVCDGVDRAYLAEFGTDELLPYERLRGEVVDRARLAYLPAFIAKAAPLADARAAVAEAFREMRNSEMRNKRDVVAAIEGPAGQPEAVL
jgi:pyrroloquinoline quinone biosynthesis protein E